MANDDDTSDLDAYFAAGRAASGPVPEAFLRRVEADALAVQDARAAATARPGRWRLWLDALGGWPVGVGLASAAAAGLVIGIVVPEGATGLDALGLLGTEGALEAFDPGYGTELFEES